MLTEDESRPIGQAQSSASPRRPVFSDHSFYDIAAPAHRAGAADFQTERGARRI